MYRLVYTSPTRGVGRTDPLCFALCFTQVPCAGSKILGALLASAGRAPSFLVDSQAITLADGIPAESPLAMSTNVQVLDNSTNVH